MPGWAIPLLLLFAVGTVWLRLRAVSLTYGISQVERAIQNTKQQRDQVQLRTAELRSPKRLERLARETFGLAPARPDRVVILSTRSAEPNR